MPMRCARTAGLFLLALLAAEYRATARADSVLADAAERGDRAAVRQFIERGAPVNQPQADGMTALLWAVRRDDVETVSLLVKAGADARAPNRFGVSPLSIACANGNAGIVTLLLQAGADPNTSLRGGETALMTAARTGKLPPVRILLTHGADVKAKERHGQTALMWAAAEGHAEVVKALIEAGADIRSALPSGYTPLTFAVREGRSSVVRLLLNAGADVNAVMVIRRGVNRGPNRGTSPLILAVENGHFELAALLLDAGADPNDQRSGYTALHSLTWVRKPNRGDDESGDPAPVGSGRLTSLQLVQTLVAHGADVNARLTKGPTGRGVLSRVGATPFLLASMTADVPLMKTLLSLGADPKRSNATHSTPLMAAAGLGCLAPTEEAGTEEEALEAVKLALELGNDVNTVDDNGETAMHGAAYKTFPRVVQLLAEQGARPETWIQKNKYGWTPLSIAEGYRPGNFKPSPETLTALRRLLPEPQPANSPPHPSPRTTPRPIPNRNGPDTRSHAESTARTDGGHRHPSTNGVAPE